VNILSSSLAILFLSYASMAIASSGDLIDLKHPSFTPPPAPPDLEKVKKQAKIFLKKSKNGRFATTTVLKNADGGYELFERELTDVELDHIAKSGRKISEDEDELIEKVKPKGSEFDTSKASAISPSMLIEHPHINDGSLYWQGNTYGNLLQQVTGRGPGTTTQWLSFMLYAEGFPSPDHLAFITRLATQQNSGFLHGLGGIFGYNSGYNFQNLAGQFVSEAWYGEPTFHDDFVKGCPGYNAQKEAFTGNKNKVFYATCLNGGVSNLTWYYVTIHSSNGSWLAYTLSEYVSGTGWVQKTNYVPGSSGGKQTQKYFDNIAGTGVTWSGGYGSGLAIFSAFSSKPEFAIYPPVANYSAPWKVYISNAQSGWY
jgi:hypothetical protein